MVELTERTIRSWEEIKAATLEELAKRGFPLPEDVDRDTIEGVILIHRNRELAKRLGLPEDSDMSKISDKIKELNEQQPDSGEQIFEEVDGEVRRQFEEFFSWKE